MYQEDMRRAYTTSSATAARTRAVTRTLVRIDTSWRIFGRALMAMYGDGSRKGKTVIRLSTFLCNVWLSVFSCGYNYSMCTPLQVGSHPNEKTDTASWFVHVCYLLVLIISYMHCE